MPRLFVAVWPTPAVAERLHRLPRPAERGVRWVPDDNLHVTIRFLGDVDSDAVAARLRHVSLPRASAVLGPTVGRVGRRVVAIPVAGLDDLAAAVRDATVGIGDPERRGFRGHLTIARVDPQARPTLLGMPCADRFDVAEVALVASELRRGGARYRTVTTFPTC